MFKIILLCVSAIGLVQGGFFDLTDVDDPLALLWNLPVHQKLSQCKMDNRHGTCMEKGKCLLTGGTPIGHCGLIFSCCSYDKNCVKTTDKKVSYFKSGNLNTAVTSCKYTIKLRNKNVCQVRLDFEELVLAPAVLTSYSTQSGSVRIYSCANDSLNINPNTYGVPVLCGNSTSQHLYIHVNQSTDPHSAVNIDINLANRLNEFNKYLPKPTWKIKFTQLECPLKKHKFDISKYGDIDNINNDFNLLAPQGAIQYHTDAMGEIRSFAFNTTTALQAAEMTSYPYLEHYTIAFRRPSDVCGIKFNPVTFNILREDKSDSTNDDTTCHHYLYIPEYFTDYSATLSESTASGRTCAEKTSFYSLPPGSLYITFKSMDTTINTTPTTTNQGFLINYELLTTCPYNSN